MLSIRSLSRLIAGVLAGVVLAYGAVQFAGLKLTSTTEGPVNSSAAEEVLVMRTKGGLLEVSTIRATESFDTKFVHQVLGFSVGETIPRIRVPAVYRYRIELAPEWKVRRNGDTFTVVAPPARPALPVAVDFSRIEKQASGTWVLLPFTEDEALNELEKRITGNLEKKAVSPFYLHLQREIARQTVAEFVRKWLLTQEQWKSAEEPKIEVLFAN